MKDFVVFDNDGKILRTGRCPDADFEIQTFEGENIIEGMANSLTQMVVNKQIIDKPNIISLEKTKHEIFLEKVAEKSKNIDLMCRNKIYAGYISSALGNDFLYPSKDKDQSNMVASITDSLNPANDDSWLTPFWCANPDGTDWAYRMHNRAQIQKAGADGKRHIVAQLQKNAMLQQLINSATSVEELDLITW